MEETVIRIDDCCKNCKDRHVGCHNIETCSKWNEHEKEKEKLYADRKMKMQTKDIEFNYSRRKMKRNGKSFKIS